MAYINKKFRLLQFTIGVEEEFQVIDPKTRELRSHMHQIVEGGKVILKEQVKAEMHQSVVEVGTNICKDVSEARKARTAQAFRKLHIRTSTYKEEYGDGTKGWHVSRGAPPKPLGGYWMKFDINLNHSPTKKDIIFTQTT